MKKIVFCILTIVSSLSEAKTLRTSITVESITDYAENKARSGAGVRFSLERLDEYFSDGYAYRTSISCPYDRAVEFQGIEKSFFFYPLTTTTWQMIQPKAGVVFGFGEATLVDRDILKQTESSRRTNYWSVEVNMGLYVQLGNNFGLMGDIQFGQANFLKDSSQGSRVGTQIGIGYNW